MHRSPGRRSSRATSSPRPRQRYGRTPCSVTCRCPRRHTGQGIPAPSRPARRALAGPRRPLPLVDRAGHRGAARCLPPDQRPGRLRHPARHHRPDTNAVHLSYATQATFPAHNFLDVSYLQGTGQVQLRVDAEVVWLPQRSPLELIPMTTRAVDVDVQPTFPDSGLPSRHVVLRGPDVFGKLVPELDFARPRHPARPAARRGRRLDHDADLPDRAPGGHPPVLRRRLRRHGGHGQRQDRARALLPRGPARAHLVGLP